MLKGDITDYLFEVPTQHFSCFFQAAVDEDLNNA